MGAGDNPAGVFCPLEFVGLPSPTALVNGIPFTFNSTRVPQSAIDAVSGVLLRAIVNGALSANGTSVYLPYDRPETQCASYLFNFESPNTLGGEPRPSSRPLCPPYLVLRH